ncbi:14-3-3 protein [Trichomonas vaginalis G3]|uniref:14-3-3 protein n=1 Tax=Trichomonas vaginalis (strain ATCC PRA-98 / G3) TaxID=412133 RepID=A2EH41_TRIV3|nr:protein domain specific binding [Trichomonas vaginalis G3]EAY08009.1 14-3-3 protein [Trichomonas vaginalis G3]KAI5537371.1 protein domain specific binding [Trichomonas vaginalis G3]|eukprot:XP_001320232.1 14-3-3 protein [Trichomonas vaginalis G3]
MSERENLKVLIEILDSTSRHDDMIKQMKRIIELEPKLSTEERNFLSVSYKNVTDVRRNSLNEISQYLATDALQHPNAIPYLQKTRAQIADELKNYCTDLISLVDEKLLPSCSDEKSRLFYIRLKADYYRYLCEAVEGEEREKSVISAQTLYNEAIEITKKEYPRYSPTYLGLFLNYSVFLHETLHAKAEALQTAMEISSLPTDEIEQNDEAASIEARTILNQNLENIGVWKQEIMSLTNNIENKK